MIARLPWELVERPVQLPVQEDRLVLAQRVETPLVVLEHRLHVGEDLIAVTAMSDSLLLQHMSAPRRPGQERLRISLLREGLLLPVASLEQQLR